MLPVGALRYGMSSAAYIDPVGNSLRINSGPAGRMSRQMRDTLRYRVRGGPPPTTQQPIDALVPIVELRTYFVEDNATIRENLIGTLEELAFVKALGWAETEAEARSWLAQNDGHWDLTIVDLFLKQGSGLGVLEACRGRSA